MNLYTDRKVYHRLAGKLPNCTPTHSDMVRYSVQGDLAGVAAQRAAHFSTYASDPDIAVISQFPEAAWDPSQPQVGARFGIVWLTLADLHHNATGDTPVAAVVAVGDTIFFNITLSTTQKHIPREDGEDENGVTRLMLGVLNHYPSLRASRFAEDVTRAGRVLTVTVDDEDSGCFRHCEFRGAEREGLLVGATTVPTTRHSWGSSGSLGLTLSAECRVPSWSALP